MLLFPSVSIRTLQHTDLSYVKGVIVSPISVIEIATTLALMFRINELANNQGKIITEMLTIQPDEIILNKKEINGLNEQIMN